MPGVGAFADAIDCLNKSGMRETMLNEIAKGKPFLGICLGMQLLFDRSFENGEYAGLSLVSGDVVPFNVSGLKVPHMGWNNLITRSSALMDAGTAHTSTSCIRIMLRAYRRIHHRGADYGYRFTRVSGQRFGLQFHPRERRLGACCACLGLS